ncbi:MAG: hypothetical protein AAFU70_11535, partial [Planctomycetota bacterium]
MHAGDQRGVEDDARAHDAGDGIDPQQAEAVGVEHFGQTGTVDDLYAHFGIDTRAIVEAASNIAAGRPVRHLSSVS